VRVSGRGEAEESGAGPRDLASVDRIGCENGEKVCDVCRGTVRSRRRARVVVRAEGFIPSQQQRRGELLLTDDSTAEHWEGITLDEEATEARSRPGSSREDGEEGESGLGLIEVWDESDGAKSEERALEMNGDDCGGEWCGKG
jgi:hypothetical protein